MEERRLGTREQTQSPRYSIHAVSGVEAILEMKDLLMAFSVRCGQAGTMGDLSYFLTKPGLLRRVPKLLLVTRQSGRRVERVKVDDLLGAVLLYEFAFLGVRALATNDRSGRGTLLASPENREQVASITARTLLERGAQMVLLSFQTGFDESDATGAGLDLSDCSRKIKWAHQRRTVHGYLPLAESYDATLARMGQKTRSHMRYYRRRAESQLGCRFDAAVSIGREEYVAFNRVCMFPVSDKVARWRFDCWATISEPVLFGMKDGKGEWLSIVGGRRFEDRTELLWQMNRDGHPTHSLATVMRAYYLEHEIGHGMKRFYIEGGTKHSIHHAFTKEQLVDFVAVRRSSASRLIEKLAVRMVPPDNELAQMLRSGPELGWSEN